MKPNEPDEPGSADYNERLWRRSRNEKIIAETQPLKEKAGSSRWQNSVSLLTNDGQPMKMCFHQFEDHLAVGDDRDTISLVIERVVLFEIFQLTRSIEFGTGSGIPA
jgi:regulator-associated protein of mTOR